MFCLVLDLVAWGQSHNGSIQGMVLDRSGHAIGRASVTWRDVSLQEKEVEVMAGAVPTVIADSTGAFTIPGLELGHRYKVYASKENENYPDMTMGLYNPKDDAVIAEAGAAGESNVAVQLGPKAARLKWSVTDAITGTGVSPVLVVQRVDSGGGLEGRFPGVSELLIPADVEIRIEVSADGYDIWYYPGSTAKSAAVPLQMKAGEVRTINVQLARTNQ